MKLTIKLNEINYGDVAVRAMPLLAQSAGNFHGAVGKTVAAIANLPDNLICAIFDAIPTEQKNEIISAFITENKERILRAVNDMSDKYMIGVHLSEWSMDQNLTISAEVDRIDYLCIVDRFLPAIKEKLLSMGGLVAMLRPMILSASADQLCGLLDRFVGDNKDAFLASLINQNQQMLISAIEDIAEKQNIHININSIVAEV